MRFKHLQGKAKLSAIVFSCCLALPGFLLFAEKTQATKASEYEIKAAYLYHFTQFIEWPASAFETDSSTFNLCLMGGNPFGDALKPIFKRTYNGRPFSLVFPAALNTIGKCHILYLNNLTKEREKEVLRFVANQPVLVVSSSQNFVEQGGNIGFLNIDDHIRFAINRTAGKERGLVSRAKLLELAVQVIDHKNGDKQQ